MSNIVKKENNGNQALSLKNRFNDLFDDFFLDINSPFGKSFPEMNFEPKVNISETDDSYKIDADLAGVNKEDIDLKCQNGVLTISAERKGEKEEKKKNYHYAESYYGSFQRSLQLPSNVDEKNVNAKFDNGVLKIVLPKSAKNMTNSGKIEIK